MTYSKPELLAANAALDAIRGSEKEDGLQDDPIQDRSPVGAYEVDE